MVMVLQAPHIPANARLKMIERTIECPLGVGPRAAGLHECARTEVHGAIRAISNPFLHECDARFGMAIEVFSHRCREPLTNVLRQGLANFDLLSSYTTLHHVSVRTSGFRPPAKLARPKKARTISRPPIPVNRALAGPVGRLQLALAAPFHGRRNPQCFTIFCDRPARDIDAFIA